MQHWTIELAVMSLTQACSGGQVEGLVELLPLRDALVGVPGINGLSVEQRKRLTIAVELVANPGTASPPACKVRGIADSQHLQELQSLSGELPLSWTWAGGFFLKNLLGLPAIV